MPDWNSSLPIGYNVGSAVSLPTGELWGVGGDIVIFAITIGLIVILLSLVGLYNSLPLYSKLKRIIEYAIQSITYFLWGLAGIASFGIIAWVIKYFAEPGDKIVSLFDIGKGIIVYLLICGIGYIIVKFKKRIKEHELKLSVSNEEKEQIT